MESIEQYLADLSIEQKQELLLKLRLESAKTAQSDLLTFIQTVNPAFNVSRHHEVISEYLMAAARGDIKRLMIFMPPRSGKSAMTSVYLPAWYLGNFPKRQVLAASYQIDLTRNWGRDVRNLVNSPEFRKVFPDVGIAKDSRSAERWATNKGGQYNAGAIKAGIAGKGAHLGIIDDPMNEKEAYSRASLDYVINWYPGGFRSRLMDEDSPIILTMTRWNVDDLAGWLLKQQDQGGEKWTTLRIPALLDEEAATSHFGWEPGMDIYAPGTTYWPPRADAPKETLLKGWSTKYLLATKGAMHPYQWEALYQQNPVVEGGNILNAKWWKRWTDSDPPACDMKFLSLDTAFSEADRASFSAITSWGLWRRRDEKGRPFGEPNLMLLGAEKGHWDYPTLKEKTLEKYQLHRPDVVLIEKTAAGQSLLQELARSNFPVVAWPAGGDKEMRAHMVAGMLYGGRIWAPAGRRWAEDVIIECANFPAANENDYVDAVTQAINWARENWAIRVKDDQIPIEDIITDDQDEDEWAAFRQPKAVKYV